MRLEATISEFRAEQLSALADELKVSKSAIVDEALSLLATGLLEARAGRRFAIIDPESQKIVTQVASPLLAQAEWIAHREKITLSRREARAVDELLTSPPEPTAALRRAAAERQRRTVKSRGARGGK